VKKSVIGQFKYLIFLFLAQLGLFFCESLELREAALFSLLLLPGFLLGEELFSCEGRFSRAVLALAFSYLGYLIFFFAYNLFFYNAPFWLILLGLDLISLVFCVRRSRFKPAAASNFNYALCGLLVLACMLRFKALGYSEYQGDEARALIFAKALTQGDHAILFLHKKGPAEILLPFGLLSGLGVVNEFGARLPFALAGLGVVAFGYLIAKRLFSDAAGLLAAFLMGIEGFLVAFSRIVQYQSVLLLLLLASIYLALLLPERRAKNYYALICLAFFGFSLWCHYDALFGLLPLSILLFREFRYQRRALIAGAAVLILILCAFYLPFILNQNFSNTAGYLGERIGLNKLPANNLPRYLSVFSFYNSAYFMALLGLILILGKLAYLKDRSVLTTERAALLFWCLVVLLAFGFLVARPNTHFYILHPALLISAAGFFSLTVSKRTLAAVFLLGFLSALYPYFAYLRPTPEFRLAYPKSLPALFPKLNANAPGGAFFGFPHLSGWKVVGSLYQKGILEGSYDSNEEELITAWYTRGAERDPLNPKYYFVASNPNDPIKLSEAKINNQYHLIGRVLAGERKLLDIFAKEGGVQAERYQAQDAISVFDAAPLGIKAARLSLGLPPLAP